MLPANYASVDLDRPAWPKPTGREHALVVDLRGNGGYSLELGLDVLRDWVPRARVPTKNLWATEVTTSCLTAPLIWTRDLDLVGDEPWAKWKLGWLQRELDALAAPTPPGCPRSVRRSAATAPGYGAHHPREGAPGPRIVALVDNVCQSDCEALVAVLATLPETIVVGVNTGGTGQFSQPGAALLPHTGLPFSIALGRMDIYGDGRSFDGYGLDVDVVLPHPEDWNDADLLKLVESLGAR
jgi:C-terminal processing protease CtpA/Prc